MRFGIPIKAYNDLHMQVTASSLLTEKDLIICVSHTGANIDLLQAIELAHNNKCSYNCHNKLYELSTL